MPEPQKYTKTLCQEVQELAKAVEEFKKEMRKTSLCRFILRLIEIKARADTYLINLNKKIICITKGHNPIWYDVGTDNSHKHCLRCKKRWYRYKRI